MAYFSKHHLDLSLMISFWGYDTIYHRFPENEITPAFLHTTEKQFGRVKQHEMKEWSISDIYEFGL